MNIGRVHFRLDLEQFPLADGTWAAHWGMACPTPPVIPLTEKDEFWRGVRRGVKKAQESRERRT